MNVGDTATMLFTMFGVTSEEEYEVILVEDGVVTLDTDECEDDCFKFDEKTGECLNDNDFGGAKRTLKIV